MASTSGSSDLMYIPSNSDLIFLFEGVRSEMAVQLLSLLNFPFGVACRYAVASASVRNMFSRHVLLLLLCVFSFPSA